MTLRKGSNYESYKGSNYDSNEVTMTQMVVIMTQIVVTMTFLSDSIERE